VRPGVFDCTDCDVEFVVPTIVDPGDYRLQPPSPCIDTGTSQGAPADDIDENARPLGHEIDMGAYECEGLPRILFRRADANADGKPLDLSDAVYVLQYLFASGPEPPCLDAADGNDDGEVDLADAIAVLNHLFAGTGDLPLPFDECGVDPTPDELGCEGFPPCEGP
jgi:hypothetical protein